MKYEIKIAKSKSVEANNLVRSYGPHGSLFYSRKIKRVTPYTEIRPFLWSHFYSHCEQFRPHQLNANIKCIQSPTSLICLACLSRISTAFFQLNLLPHMRFSPNRVNYEFHLLNKKFFSLLGYNPFVDYNY